MNEIIELICDESERMDRYISGAVEDVSRSYIQKLIEKGCVKVNGQVVTSKKEPLNPGDRVTIDFPEPESIAAMPENIPLDIVYEDDDVLVVNKPQGMVVHPAPGNPNGTLVNALMYFSDRLSSINGVIRPGIVHRIDKDTSGLLMVAKNDVAHASLAKQLEEKTVLRVYYAIVYGVVKADSGTVDAPLGRHPHDRIKFAIVAGGKRAVTHYEVLERFEHYTLVALRLETGRTHQIRVHMASIGHPVLGDPVYGTIKGKIKYDGQALHAKTLGFVHPTTGEWMVFDSELPEYFVMLLEKCRALK